MVRAPFHTGRGPAIERHTGCLGPYGMPVQVMEDVVEARTYFSDLDQEFGFVVYTHDGIPVSTATAIDLGAWVYIAAVATEAEY